MQRGVVLSVGLIILVITAGCTVPGPRNDREEPRRYSSWITEYPSKVNATTVTNDDLDGAPRFQELLNETLENSSARASLTAETGDQIWTVINGTPYYNPQATPKPYPDVVYLHVNESVFLVHPENRSRRVSVRTADPGSENITAISKRELSRVPELRRAIREAAPTYRVIKSDMTQSQFDAVVRFLSDRTRYRPGGSRRPHRGFYVRYRNTSIGVRMWHNTSGS